MVAKNIREREDYCYRGQRLLLVDAHVYSLLVEMRVLLRVIVRYLKTRTMIEARSDINFLADRGHKRAKAHVSEVKKFLKAGAKSGAEVNTREILKILRTTSHNSLL
jgi:hypothetical protein